MGQGRSKVGNLAWQATGEGSCACLCMCACVCLRSRLMMSDISGGWDAEVIVCRKRRRKGRN